MSRLWFTADLHLTHAFVAQERGYPTAAEHDAALAAEWDRTVAPDDTVWVLGDVCVGGAQRVRDSLAWVRARPGVKHLVSGNHDRTHPMHRDAYAHHEQWREAFATIQSAASKRIAGHRVLLSHFPYLGAPNGDHTEIERFSQWRLPAVDPDTWILHGHTHAKRRCDAQWRSIHVGVDAWRTLVSQQTIEDMISKYSHVPAVFMPASAHRIVRTAKELDALPPGTVVRTANPNAIPGVALWTMRGDLEPDGPWWQHHEDDSFTSKDVLYGYGAAEVIWLSSKEES